MPTIKPKFPQVSAQQLKQELARAKREVEKATKDGKLDVHALNDGMMRSDKTLEKAYLTICDSIEVTHQSKITGKRYGGTPDAVEGAKAQRTLDAFEAAGANLDKIAGSDGIVSEQEAAAARKLVGNDLAGELSLTMLDAALLPHQDALRQWRMRLADTYSRVNGRKDLDRDIRELAKQAETNEGREAVRWAYLAKMVTPGEFQPIRAMDKELKSAETSAFGTLFGKEGHLDDAELKRLFKTSDLEKFAAQQKAAFEKQVGSLDSWLQGRDLPGIDELNDPDFTKNRWG